MKILNVIWKFTTGGIGKCFISYATCGKYDNSTEIVNYCIDPQDFDYDRKPLFEINACFIKIKNRKDFSWINQLHQAIIAEKPDVIFTHGQYGPIIIQTVKLFHKDIRQIPIIGSYHGLYNPPTKKKILIAGVLNRFQCWLYKHYVKKVVIVSKFSGNYLLKHGVQREKLAVVYNGLPSCMNQVDVINLAPNHINIGLVARIDAIKGIDYLLEAINIIKEQQICKFHLYVIGDGPLLEVMKEEAIKKHVSDDVTFTGYQSNIAAWMNAFDIFVLSSLQENHSIALLEAMRAGKAIVCTDVGGNPETVVNEKEALVVPARNSIALAKALQRLIDSKELRCRLGKAAEQRFLDSFTEEISQKSLIKVFKSVL